MRALAYLLIIISLMVAASNPATMGFFIWPAMITALALFLGRGEKSDVDIQGY